MELKIVKIRYFHSFQVYNLIKYLKFQFGKFIIEDLCSILDRKYYSEFITYPSLQRQKSIHHYVYALLRK